MCTTEEYAQSTGSLAFIHVRAQRISGQLCYKKRGGYGSGVATTKFNPQHRTTCWKKSQRPYKTS